MIGHDDLYCLFYSLEEKVDAMLDLVSKEELEEWSMALVQMSEKGKVDAHTILVLKKLDCRLRYEWLRRHGRRCHE